MYFFYNFTICFETLYFNTAARGYRSSIHKDCWVKLPCLTNKINLQTPHQYFFKLIFHHENILQQHYNNCRFVWTAMDSKKQSFNYITHKVKFHSSITTIFPTMYLCKLKCFFIFSNKK